MNFERTIPQEEMLPSRWMTNVSEDTAVRVLREVEALYRLDDACVVCCKTSRGAPIWLFHVIACGWYSAVCAFAMLSNCFGYSNNASTVQPYHQNNRAGSVYHYSIMWLDDIMLVYL